MDRKPRRSKVFLIHWPSQPEMEGPLPRGTRITVAVLFPPEVKRRLATIEAATRHALDLARNAIARTSSRPGDLNRLTCTVEVTRDDLFPPGRLYLRTEDGTELWLEEVEQG
jgi:hypothetical protein